MNSEKSGRISKSQRSYLKSIPRLDKHWSSPSYKHSSLHASCFSFSIWRSGNSYGVLREDRVRGHSVEELLVVAVSRAEATAQGRWLGSQSSVPLDSELIISTHLDLRWTTPDSPWACTHQSHLLIIYWGQVVALTVDVEGGSSFLPFSAIPLSFPSSLFPVFQYVFMKH